MNVWKEAKPFNFLMLTLAGLANALGIILFLAPVSLFDSGVSGTAMLAEKISPAWMSLSLFLLLFNIPLFLYGYKKQGPLFTLYAVYTVCIYSLCAWILGRLLPYELKTVSYFARQDLLLCSLFGGLISGIGSGLAIRFGGAMDGIEVMAVIFSGKLGISVGTFVMAYNVLLYIICGLILQSWILPLYSVIAYMGALKTVDFMVEGLDRAKSAMIVTDQTDTICKNLSDAFGSAPTKIHAVGGYSNTRKTIIYFVVNRFQVPKMKEIVRNSDPNAYVTISEVADVFAKHHDL